MNWRRIARVLWALSGLAWAAAAYLLFFQDRDDRSVMLWVVVCAGLSLLGRLANWRAERASTRRSAS